MFNAVGAAIFEIRLNFRFVPMGESTHATPPHPFHSQSDQIGRQTRLPRRTLVEVVALNKGSLLISCKHAVGLDQPLAPHRLRMSAREPLDIDQTQNPICL